MTDTDTSELHALADIVLADFENSDGSNETVLQMCGRIIAGGFRRDPDLLDELDQLREQVARVDNIRKSLEDAGMTVTRQHGSEMPSEWVEWVNAPVDSVLGLITQALAVPAEGGE